MDKSVKILIAHRMASLAIPKGTPNPLIAGTRAITEPGRLASIAKEAAAWVQQVIGLMRQAAEPNPWKQSTDEEIAAELLRQVAEREAAIVPTKGGPYG